MSLSSKAVATMAALAVGAVPATTAAVAATKPGPQAVKSCKAQQKKLGKTKFAARYGKKSALLKCETTYDKKHKVK
jgi:hypothetical protein